MTPEVMEKRGRQGVTAGSRRGQPRPRKSVSSGDEMISPVSVMQPASLSAETLEPAPRAAVFWHAGI